MKITSEKATVLAVVAIGLVVIMVAYGVVDNALNTDEDEGVAGIQAIEEATNFLTEYMVNRGNFTYRVDSADVSRLPKGGGNTPYQVVLYLTIHDRSLDQNFQMIAGSYTEYTGLGYRVVDMFLAPPPRTALEGALLWNTYMGKRGVR